MKHLAILIGIVFFSWFSVNDNKVNNSAIRLDEIELNLTNIDYIEELESVDNMYVLEEIELNITNFDYENELESIDNLMQLDELVLDLENLDYLEELELVDSIMNIVSKI